MAGDFNGDGRTDLAVANDGSNDVSVLLGNGDGTFQTQVDRRGGVRARRHRGGRLQRRRPHSTWPSPTAAPTTCRCCWATATAPSSPRSPTRWGRIPTRSWRATSTATAGLDLAVANYGSTTTCRCCWATATAPSSPRSPTRWGRARSPSWRATSTATAALDLAVANSGDNDVSVLLGNGDGTFQPQVTYAVGSDPDALVAGDFNGDGRTRPGRRQRRLDDDVSVLLGNGDGTFQPQVTYAVGSDPDALVAGDFNGDGRTRPGRRQRSAPTTCRCCWATATARSSPRSPTRWGPIPTPSWRATSTATAGLDLAVANCGSNDVSVLLGNGDGTFQPQVTYAVGSSPYAIVAGDFNGDGQLDLAVANYGANDVSVLLGNGDGTFVDPGQFATTPHATPLVADVNGDGTDDVLVVDGAGDILYRQGIPGQPGRFAPPVTVNPGYPSRDIAWVPNTDRRARARQRRRPRRRDLALRLARRRLRPGRLARHRPAPGADHRGRPQRRRLGRPGRPQRRRRHAFGLLRQPSSVRSRHPGPLDPRASCRPSPYPSAWASPTSRRSIPPASGRARPGRHQQADRPGERPAQPGRRRLRPAGALSRRDRACPRSIPAARPRSPAWRRRRAWPPGRSRPAVRPTW